MSGRPNLLRLVVIVRLFAQPSSRSQLLLSANDVGEAIRSLISDRVVVLERSGRTELAANCAYRSIG